MTKPRKLSLRQVATTNKAIKKAAASLPPPPVEEVLTDDELAEAMKPSRADLAVLAAVARGQTFGQTRDMLAAIRMKLEFSVRKPESRGSGGSPVNVTIKMLKSDGVQSVTTALEDPAPDAAQYDENEDLQ